MKTEHSVLKVILRTVKQNKGMCVTLFAAVLGSAVFALLPPLVLAKAIDYLTAGQTFPFALALSYFGLLLLTNAATSLRESLLTIFGSALRMDCALFYARRSAFCLQTLLFPMTQEPLLPVL